MSSEQLLHFEKNPVIMNRQFLEKEMKDAI